MYIRVYTYILYICMYLGIYVGMYLCTYCVYTVHSSLQGLIFVVDSNDRERMTEARDELSNMVSIHCAHASM